MLLCKNQRGRKTLAELSHPRCCEPWAFFVKKKQPALDAHAGDDAKQEMLRGIVYFDFKGVSARIKELGARRRRHVKRGPNFLFQDRVSIPEPFVRKKNPTHTKNPRRVPKNERQRDDRDEQ